MTEIKRYKIEDNFLDLGVKGGLFVREKDYAALQEQVRALAAEYQSLRKFCENSAFDADYEAELCMERGGFSDGLNDIKTPATDAALREIRAQVLDDMADNSEADWLDAYIDELRARAARIRSGEQP